MINLRFSKLPKHRKFNYIPVFYDEDKEDLDARVDDMKREMGRLEANQHSVKENIRRSYRAKDTVKRYGTAGGSSRMYTVRVAIIAILLTVIVYNLWDSNLLEIIFESFTK